MPGGVSDGNVLALFIMVGIMVSLIIRDMLNKFHLRYTAVVLAVPYSRLGGRQCLLACAHLHLRVQRNPRLFFSLKSVSNCDFRCFTIGVTLRRKRTLFTYYAVHYNYCIVNRRISLLLKLVFEKVWPTHGRRPRVGLGGGPPKTWGGGGPCIRPPPNILRSSVIGSVRKYEQKEKRTFVCEI